MTTAFTLLVSAIQLLTLVSTAPNLTPEFKQSAIDIANQAIAVAQTEMQKAQDPVENPQPPLTIATSSFAILEPISPPTNVGAATSTMPQVQKEIRIDIESYMANQNGVYVNLFVYYLEDGRKKAGAQVAAEAPDGTFGNSTVTTEKVGYGDGSPAAFFQYVPETAGERTLTFTGNGATGTVTVRGK